MKATAKGDVAVKAFDRTIKYVKLYLNDASLETFYQEDHSLAARTFQRINNVFFDAFNENRAVNTSEIDKIMIESGYKRYKNN